VFFLLIFVGLVYGAGLNEKQGLTTGAGFAFETFAVAFGGGMLLHTGDLLPFLIYFSVNSLQNLSGYSLLTLDLGTGFKLFKP